MYFFGNDIRDQGMQSATSEGNVRSWWPQYLSTEAGNGYSVGV